MSLGVIGGGAIGCELTQAFARLGVKVTLIESALRLLPAEEPAASEVIAQVFKRERIELRLGAQIIRVQRPTRTLVCLDLDDGSHVTAQTVLVAVGRRPLTNDFDLPAAASRWTIKVSSAPTSV